MHCHYSLDGSLLAEADAATGATLRVYIWLPQDDASPAADNDNEEGAEPPWPLGKWHLCLPVAACGAPDKVA